MVEIVWKGAHREVSSFSCLHLSRSCVPNRTLSLVLTVLRRILIKKDLEHCKLSHSTDTKSVVRET